MNRNTATAIDNSTGTDEPPASRTAARRVSRSARGRDLIVAEIAALCDSGDALLRVAESGRPGVLRARSLVDLRPQDLGREAVVQFERGDPSRPIVLGLLRKPGRHVRPATDRLVLEADSEIVLRCGKSSIVLAADGKLMIRGEYVVSRSNGVNRLNGASVQIN